MLLFSCFFSLYSVALTGNILIILAITFNPGLHTPRYFFLFNLATMDIICTSSIMPKGLEGLVSEKNFISYEGCMAQLYFLNGLHPLSCSSSQLWPMTDWYAAICHPLHYSTMMNKAFCSALAAGVWVLCAFHIAIHTGLILHLNFCGPNVITHVF